MEKQQQQQATEQRESKTFSKSHRLLLFVFFTSFSYSLLIQRSRRQEQFLTGGNVPRASASLLFGPTKPTHFPICEMISNANGSPHQLWIKHLERIRQASRLDRDPDFVLQGVTSAVLLQISELLPQSLKTLPAEDLTKLVQKMEKRYHYLRYPYLYAASSPPPPITITVLGGSVTAGVQCDTGIPAIRNQRCAWPTRLEQFINKVVKMAMKDNPSAPDFVKVHTLAVGGTNTATGQAILDFDVLPPEASQPDILINAYSTNDMHVLTMQDALESNVTIRDMVFSMHQDFVRTVMKCPNRPILFWLDDYIGNEQREILATQELAQSVHVLSNYYGFGFVSYADAVRTMVYGDTKETTFSPAGWYTGSGSRMKREIHPGQGMHMSVAWMMAFSMFSSVSNHCTKNDLLLKLDSLQVPPGEIPPDRRDTVVNGKSLQKHLEDSVPVSPQPRPLGLPPRLTSELRLDYVASLWQRDSHKILSDCLVSTALRCPVSWVSGIPWREERWIEHFFRPILQGDVGWSLLDDSNGRGKLGWIPRNDTTLPEMRMKFNEEDHRAGNLRTVTLFYMKSYGPRWEGSEAVVHVEHRVSRRWKAAATPEVLTGIHNKATSEMYTQTIAIEQTSTAAPVSALQVRIVHTGGSTFKLMGIAVCQ